MLAQYRSFKLTNSSETDVVKSSNSFSGTSGDDYSCSQSLLTIFPMGRRLARQYHPQHPIPPCPSTTVCQKVISQEHCMESTNQWDSLPFELTYVAVETDSYVRLRFIP